MIAALTFGAPFAVVGHLLRPIGFAPRSTLPLSAACLVANGVREALGRLLGAELDVELTEPAIPGADERRILVAGATVLRVRGRICDGFVIVRPDDARRLVALAFAEDDRPESDALSEIERATLERVVAALVPLCNTLCGTLGPVTRELPERASCDLATYFEVRTTGRIRAALGFALTSDPAEEIVERLTLADLGDVELEGRVTCARGALGVPAFSRLRAGATLLLDTPLGAAGTLHFGDVAFARGVCGARDGRNAIAFASGTERDAA